jgi:hypothetical protein
LESGKWREVGGNARLRGPRRASIQARRSESSERERSLRIVRSCFSNGSPVSTRGLLNVDPIDSLPKPHSIRQTDQKQTRCNRPGQPKRMSNVLRKVIAIAIVAINGKGGVVD